MKKLVGIDGNSIMNRAFYGIMNSKLLMTSDGIYTNAIYGFLSILNKLINDEKPDYICVAFDLKAPTFRHKKYEGYVPGKKRFAYPSRIGAIPSSSKVPASESKFNTLSTLLRSFLEKSIQPNCIYISFFCLEFSNYYSSRRSGNISL